MAKGEAEELKASAEEKRRSAKLTEIDEEIRQAEREIVMMRLKITRKEVAKFDTDERTTEEKHKAAQESLRAEFRGAQMRQAGCAHLTGGFGNEDTYSGDDKPSVIEIELSVPGHKYGICFRCQKEWRTPDPVLRLNPTEMIDYNGTRMERGELYLIQMAEWKEFMQLNRAARSKPMGGPVFNFTKDGVPFVPALK